MKNRSRYVAPLEELLFTDYEDVGRNPERTQDPAQPMALWIVSAEITYESVCDQIDDSGSLMVRTAQNRRGRYILRNLETLGRSGALCGL